jgi:hypothetical protein
MDARGVVEIPEPLRLHRLHIFACEVEDRYYTQLMSASAIGATVNAATGLSSFIDVLSQHAQVKGQLEGSLTMDAIFLLGKVASMENYIIICRNQVAQMQPAHSPTRRQWQMMASELFRMFDDILSVFADFICRQVAQFDLDFR